MHHMVESPPGASRASQTYSTTKLFRFRIDSKMDDESLKERARSLRAFVEKNLGPADRVPERGFKCPIDTEVFDTLEALSTHRDQVHIGPGLLEAYGRKK